MNETVRRYFGHIAHTYDRNNTILSLGLCKKWNRALAEAVGGETLLDLCAGTGAITFQALRKEHPPMKAILLDFSSEMLAVAQARAPSDQSLIFLEADAQDIPLPEESVDGVTQAYGIRNVPDPVQCGREVLRVLKPGGRWGILELTRPQGFPWRLLHNLYLRLLVPLAGRLLSPDAKAYRYLAQSVATFVAPNALASQLTNLGFRVESQRPLLFGTATLLVLSKPIPSK